MNSIDRQNATTHARYLASELGGCNPHGDAYTPWAGRKNFYHRLAELFSGPVPWLLEAALILAVILGQWDTMAMLFILLLSTAGIGVWRENRSKAVLQQLHTGLPPQVNAAGAIPLTQAMGAVGAGKYSSFHRGLLELGYGFVTAAALLVILIVNVGAWRDDPLLDTLLFTLMLIVVCIPHAAPAVFTAALIKGAKKLADNGVLISDYNVIEKIAGLNVSGVDKRFDVSALRQADMEVAVADAPTPAGNAADIFLIKPGPEVVANALAQARLVFQNLTNYIAFRVAETLRLLVLAGAAILVLDFYPLTPTMLVLLAFLNDFPLLTVATDSSHPAPYPLKWDIRRLLTVAAVLALGGIAASGLLLWYVHDRLHLAPEIIQTLLFLQLVLTAPLTLLLVRNRGWFWEKPWPQVLLWTGFGVQVLGALIAGLGLLMPAIGWGYALAVWGYGILWLLLLNGMKILSYRLYDHYFLSKRALFSKKTVSSF